MTRTIEEAEWVLQTLATRGNGPTAKVARQLLNRVQDGADPRPLLDALELCLHYGLIVSQNGQPA